MKMRNGFAFIIFYVACLPLFSGGFLHAQTADRIERLLEQKSVSYKDAALLALQAAGQADADAADADAAGADAAGAEAASAEAAFNYAMERGWLPKGAAADGAARLSGLSLLVMQAFDIKGGAFFFLFKTPHYAYRALVYKGIVHGRADPQMLVSGDLLLYTVNRVMK
jgi:hypothetical protein